MKTPRELLLARHASVTPKLDALRRRVVDDYVTNHQAAITDAHGEPLPFTFRLWQELFKPCRWAWLGLTALWLIIVPLHFLSPIPAAPTNLSMQNRNSISLSDPILAEQLRLRAQLLQSEGDPSFEVDRAKRPSPRTDRPHRQRHA